MDIPISCCPFFRWIYARQTLESIDTQILHFFSKDIPSIPFDLATIFKNYLSRKDVRFSSIVIYEGYTWDV